MPAMPSSIRSIHRWYRSQVYSPSSGFIAVHAACLARDGRNQPECGRCFCMTPTLAWVPAVRRGLRWLAVQGRLVSFSTVPRRPFHDATPTTPRPSLGVDETVRSLPFTQARKGSCRVVGVIQAWPSN